MVISRIMNIIFLLLLCSTSLYSWKMEADTMVVKQTTGDVITHINFRQSYDTVPLVFTMPTDVGSDSATIRVNNITKTGFDVYVVEPDGNDGPHAEMSTVPYIAIEEGSQELPNGTKIVASKVSTNKFQSRLISGQSWESISLSGFSSTPVVLGQIQSRNSERTDVIVPDAPSQPWMTTTIRSVSSSGFELALERSETQTGTVQNEDVAYLAMESGLNGGNHYFTASGAERIEYETIRSADIIKGWSNSSTGYVVNFSKSYPDPMVVTTKNTRDGGDGGWLRRRNITNSSIALVVDEDIANDSDRSHITEIAGVVLFSEAFDVDFIPNIQLSKNSLTVYDPVNLEVNPKAIPGALLVYSIVTSNEGFGAVDEDSIAMTDNIPSNMKLCVSTINRCSEIGFVDGTVSSTLSLGSLEYSNNNGTDFLYVVTPDAQGFDSAVTNVRVKLNGSFKKSDGVNHPSFTLELKMGVI